MPVTKICTASVTLNCETCDCAVKRETIEKKAAESIRIDQDGSGSIRIDQESIRPVLRRTQYIFYVAFFLALVFQLVPLSAALQTQEKHGNRTVDKMVASSASRRPPALLQAFHRLVHLFADTVILK